MNSSSVFIIAEAGVNHNGDLELAHQLIDVAVSAGADAVKFQTFLADKLTSKTAPKAQYQKASTDTAETQYEMLKKLEISNEAHFELVSYATAKGIQFMSTPFDIESVTLLADTLNLPVLKISSGDLTNAPLLLKAAGTNKEIIISTGMSDLSEIETALGVLAFGYLGMNDPSIRAFKDAYYSEVGRALVRERVTILHCTTEYPALFEEVNLRVMDTLRNAFGLRVGFSDHTPGIAVPLAAVARGARVIEKHFTLDKNMPGPDHKASLDPNELKAMIQAIRQVEASLGQSYKIPVPSEMKNINVARKSLVAALDIKEGEAFTDKNLTVKRPGYGISPIEYWDTLGKNASRSYRKDEVIQR